MKTICLTFITACIFLVIGSEYQKKKDEGKWWLLKNGYYESSYVRFHNDD